MPRSRSHFVMLVAALLVVVTGCTTPPPEPPLPDPVIDPAGHVDARVGTTVTFAVENIAGAVAWSVNDVPGGTQETGTVTDGEYQAPARVPAEPTVTITASEAASPTRQASADVTITAAGTLYVFDTTVHVYNGLDTVDGNVAPDRSFTLAGVSSEFYDMALAPALDMAFISVQTTSPNVYRLADISTANGELTATAFSSLAYVYPAGLAYDDERDVLYVQAEGALLAYHDASTAPADQEPTRIVAGPSLDTIFTSDARLSLDVESDRLFISNPDGFVAVYDTVSTIDGEEAPHRLVDLDAAHNYLWGAAYDASRDELYLGDQMQGVGVYVIADASAADGLVAPARSLGGAINPFAGASQIGYDVANDRLVVIDADDNDVKVFDAASSLDGDVPPSRVIGGDLLPLDYPYGGYLDPTQ